MSIGYVFAKLLKKLRGSAIKNSNIDKSSKIEAGSHVVNSSFGRHSFCGYDCEIVNCDIGAFTSIANNVKIGGGRHPMEWVGMSPVFYEGRDSVKAKFSQHKREQMPKTLVGNDVWIGERVLIKSGVTIGDGSVIGMGSVVTKDVGPYEVVAGCPAKHIRMRFEEGICQELHELEWWNFSDEKLNGLAVYMTDPAEFIRKAKNN